MGVTISQATAHDRDAVIELWQAAGLTRPWNDPVADFDLAVAGPNSSILLANESDLLVGCVMVGFDGHRGWVYYLAVHAEHRRKAIGRQLMHAAEAWLQQNGSPKIQLMVRAGNDEVRAFYAKLGYELQDVVTIGKRLD